MKHDDIKMLFMTIIIFFAVFCSIFLPNETMRFRVALESGVFPWHAIHSKEHYMLSMATNDIFSWFENHRKAEREKRNAQNDFVGRSTSGKIDTVTNNKSKHLKPKMRNKQTRRRKNTSATTTKQRS